MQKCLTNNEFTRQRCWSTVEMHARKKRAHAVEMHFYIEMHFYCISIFLPRKSIYLFELCACISTVFQHLLRVKSLVCSTVLRVCLLYSSILRVHFNAFLLCSSISLRAFLLCSSTLFACISIVFKYVFTS